MKNDLAEGRRTKLPREDAAEQWKAAFDSNPAMYFIVGAEGTIVAVNAYGAEKLGYTTAELIGRPVEDFIYPPDRDGVRAHTLECFSQPGRKMSWEAGKIRKDGSILWVRETANAVGLRERPVLLVACEDITEQRRAEDAARRSETELHELIENVPAMVFVALPGPSNVFASRGWREYTGLSGQDTSGSGWQEALHPDDRTRHLDKWRVCSATGEPFQDEARFLRAADGEYRWFLVRAASVRNEAGTILKWLGVLTDIEERKQVEAYLAESQRLTRTGSWGWDPYRDERLYWSEEMFRILGVDPKQTTRDWGAFDLIHPEDRDRVRETVANAMRDKTGLVMEYRLVLPDGTLKHLHAIGRPVLDKNGALARYVGTTVDVTERRRAEEKIRQSEAELRQLIDVIPQQVCVFGPDWTPLFANQRERDYTGVSLEAAKSKEVFASKVYPEDLEKLEEIRERARLEPGPFELEARIKGKDGNYRWFLIQDNPLRDERGRVVRWYGTRTDIEDRKLAEGARRQVEAYLAEAQRLSHTGSWAFNAAGFEYWSSELFRIHGLDPSGRAPSTEEYLMLVHPDDREFVARTIGKMFADHRGFDFTKRIVRPDGAIRYVRCVGSPVSRDGTFQGFIGSAVDVTEQEELTEALRRSEFYLTEGQRLGRAGSWAFSPGGYFDYWSQELFQIYGLDPQEGAPTLERYLATIHPEDRDFMAETIKRMLEQGCGCDVKKRIVLPDGALRYIRCVGIPLLDKGILKGFLGTAVDITEQEQLTQELQRREAYLAEAQRLSQTGSFGWRPDTGEIVWTDETYRIFEFDRAETPTMDMVLQRTHPDDRALVRQVIDQVSGSTNIEREYRLVMPGGAIKHVNVKAHAAPDSSDHLEVVGAVTDITERKRAEQALHQSETYLAEAQRMSKTGSFAWSPTADTTYFSEECYRLLGFEPQGASPPSFATVLQRIHPDDRARVTEQVQNSMLDKVDVEVDHRIVLPDKSVRDIHCVGHVVLGPSRELVGLVGTVMDVTERKRAEEALRQSEAYLAEAQRLSKTGSFAWSPTANTTYFSEECYRVLGFEPEAGAPPPFETTMQRIHPDDQARCIELVERSIRDKVDLEVDYRIIHPDKRVRDIHCVGRIVLDRSGELLEIVGTVIDVTERKHAEETLRQSEAYLAEAQRLSHTGSWASTANGEPKYWSEECYRVLGFDPKEPLPSLEAVLQQVHPDDRASISEQFASGIRDKADFEMDMRVVDPITGIRNIRSTCRAVLDERGDLFEMVGTVIDITEHKRVEEERERLHQLESDLAHVNRVSMLGELAASLSHEIKQPIAAAITNANACVRWLARDVPDLQEARAAARMIVQNGNRAADVINRVRSLYTKSTPAVRELIDVREVLDEMLVLLRSEANRDSIAMRADVAGDLPRIMADRVQLQQVLMNLILNGIESMKGSGGELTISSELGQDGQVLISVGDTGVGLPAGKSDQIFDAFFTTKPEGSGMGLAISRSIVESHGGRLWADSNAGGGATFSFTLPAATSPRE